ncbi:allophanate hydrolase [Aquabacterium fontiphilum]|uniref:allophanate hydrolase n=1 Tax=Aquabacterium fontiphilum TaxID=450365 RepID=UPI001376AEFE|nr:allophanate hydrolase [Aquabacterium fontiphilum]NBD21202.1 allophanate hydrolase [Aquabacterium fontiphilum]
MTFFDLPSPATVPHTIAGLLAAYREGLTPAAVLAHLWHRWQALPASDAAWIARATAAQLQTQLDALAGQSPDTLPLYGVPFAVKDNIDVAGWPTTAACPAFAYKPDETAEVVQRLQRAGAILVGKTNLDQFATGLVGVRSPYGAPRSSFSAAHVSGGSSSGSAVVVARGEVPFALGTDTAGSGRVPAGFNNVVGLKPTPGRVSTHGVLPACRSLDCVSVFALTAADAARVLAQIDGLRPGEPCFNPHAPGPARLPRSLRVGIPAVPVFDGDAAYAKAFEAARGHCETLVTTEGAAWPAQMVPVDMAPLFEVARLLYDGPWVAERHAAIDAFIRTQPDALHPTVREIIASASNHSAVDAFRGLYRLRELATQLAPLWQQIDVLMVPTAPTHPTVASVEAEPVARNALLGTYTNFVNLLGWSALAMPAGFTAEGLPFGVTFIGPPGADAALLDLGLAWQRNWQARQPAALGCALPPPAPSDLAEPPPLRAEPTLALAVVGAHLSGMPLHSQLVERHARLLATTQTAPHYRLFALPGTVPPKPGLARLSPDDDPALGHAIALEVYAVPQSAIGSFLALIPPPLGLGSVELADGSWVKGFICEPAGLAGAEDISHFGGWRAYIRHRQEQTA